MEDESTWITMEAVAQLLSDDSMWNMLINLNQMMLAEFLRCWIDNAIHIQVFNEQMTSSKGDTVMESWDNPTFSVIKATTECFCTEGGNDNNRYNDVNLQECHS